MSNSLRICNACLGLSKYSFANFSRTWLTATHAPSLSNACKLYEVSHSCINLLERQVSKTENPNVKARYFWSHWPWQSGSPMIARRTRVCTQTEIQFTFVSYALPAVHTVYTLLSILTRNRATQVAHDRSILPHLTVNPDIREREPITMSDV